MAATYRNLLDKIRLGFPQPVSDRVRDSYLIHSLLRALDKVDELKSEVPILGRPVEPDFAAARLVTVPEGGTSPEAVTAKLVAFLEGMPIFGHPRSQRNVNTQPTIPSLIG